MDGSEFIDVELSLSKKYFTPALLSDKTEYLVEFRSISPDEGADVRRVGEASFDLKELDKKQLDWESYGEVLGRSLFQGKIKEAFAEALASAQSKRMTLRLRLLIKPEADELHSLYWETLRYPDEKTSLLTTDENLPFSRYLLSKNYRSSSRRVRGELQALVAISNPLDLKEYDLDPIDVNAELERAEKSLGNIKYTALPDKDTGHQASLENLTGKLRPGKFDILYLVCHGTQQKGEPYIWLEDENRQSVRISGTEFIARLSELRHLPYLIVLASCESASDDGAGVLAALGPRLVEEGVPAVIAMQGKVSMPTLSKFMPVFFQNLEHYGEIDRAMAIARGTVRTQFDFWMPVLYMRLKDGSLWYEPGFRGERGERVRFRGWPGLISSIRLGKCTPILGPGLYEWLVGSHPQIARSWADRYEYPLVSHERESLVHVAQYLVATQRRAFVIDQLRQHIQKEILKYHSDLLTPQFLETNPTLEQLIESVGIARRRQDEYEPYAVLSRMPFPIYLTANPGNLLIDALRESDNHKGGTKDPQVVLSPWNDATEKAYHSSILAKEIDYTPSPERPLVFQFFGRLDQGESLVLTEDDYFDFLLGINKKLIPDRMKSALVNSSLLFLGFQMEDWNFRTLLRYILSFQGSGLQKDHIHVAVQINPEESGFLKPDGAYDYLGKYFSYEANIEVYWGTTEDFIKELKKEYDHWAT